MNDMTAPIVEALPVAIETVALEPENPDQSYDDIYDRMTADGVQDEPDPEEPAPVVEEVAVEEPAPVVDIPADLPSGIKEKWAGMAEDVREAVLASHRDLGRKLADQGRIVQASRPVYDVLVKAAEELPALKGMTPAHIAHDMLAMAKIQNDLVTDPVRTILGVAMQYGAIDGIRAALAGQQAPANPAVSPRDLQATQARVDRALAPEVIDQRIEQTIAVRENQRMVQEYASAKPYWGDVEAVVADMIPVAIRKLGEGASAKDVLDAAYDMAVHADPVTRAKVQAAVKPLTPDPALAMAQRNAKSINVQSQLGKAKALTEDQQYDAIWDKHQN